MRGTRLAVMPCVGVIAPAEALPARGQAGYFAEELGSDAEALVEKEKLDMMSRGSHGSEKGIGPAPYLKALGGPPKRVGLISYYTIDIGNVKETSALTTAASGWYARRSVSVKQEGLALINQALHDAGLPAMKEAFAAHHMELLTPQEFLDTAEKKAAHDAFVLDAGGSGGVASFLNKLNKQSYKATDPADGYRLIDLPRLNVSDQKMYGLAAKGGSKPLFEGLGHGLATSLGLDAVLVVYNVLQAEKKQTNLIGTYAYMFGPNPVPQSEQKLSWTGHQYAGAWMKLEVPLVKSKGDEVAYDFDGSAVVARAVAERAIRHVEDEIAGR